jgi:GR25 family glycosyltransferase involved in LPS biosynthesis
MNLRIYCINLKSRADRWERFFQQPGFQELIQKYPWERFDAIDGKTIDIEKDTRVSLRTRRNIMYKKRRDHEDLDSAGGVGCYLSHYTVWTKIIAQPEEYGLVFEDDAQ